MASAFINGMGVALPNDPVDNAHIEDVLGRVGGRPSRSKARVLQSNGIEQRYYAIDPATGRRTHTNAQLTAEAIRDLWTGTRSGPEGLDCLACGTSSPDQWIPNHALMVQAELACPPCEVVSLMGVCCAGIAAMKYGAMAVGAGEARTAVVTGSELVSSQIVASFFQARPDDKKLPFEKDFLRWMLSDGAGAALIEGRPRDDGPSLEIEWIEIVAYANELETCMYAGARKEPDGRLRGWREVDHGADVGRDGYLDLKQDARILRHHVIDQGVRHAWPVVRERRGLDPDSLAWFLPHYSSELFRQELHDAMEEMGCGVPYERWFTNLRSKGNIGSASAYVMLAELFASGRLSSGDRVLCMVPESARFTYAFVLLTVV